MLIERLQFGLSVFRKWRIVEKPGGGTTSEAAVRAPRRVARDINPASTEKFFFEFWSDFLVCFPLRPLDMGSERKFFLSLPEV